MLKMIDIMNDVIESWVEESKYLPNQVYIFERGADRIRVCLTDKETGVGTKTFLNRCNSEFWDEKEYQAKLIGSLKITVPTRRADNVKY